jgi:hypothetical protein
MKNKTTSFNLGRCESLFFDDRRARTFFGVFYGRFALWVLSFGASIRPKIHWELFQVEEVKVELVDVDVVVRMKRDCICMVDVGCKWVQSGRWMDRDR